MPDQRLPAPVLPHLLPTQVRQLFLQFQFLKASAQKTVPFMPGQQTPFAIKTHHAALQSPLAHPLLLLQKGLLKLLVVLLHPPCLQSDLAAIKQQGDAVFKGLPAQRGTDAQGRKHQRSNQQAREQIHHRWLRGARRKPAGSADGRTLPLIPTR